VTGTETIRVTIPQGVKEGSKVRVAGKGQPGTYGGPAGDLYLIVHVEPHPLLRREDDNLYMEVPVGREAILGGTVTIPTVEEVNLKVPAGVKGQTFKLKEGRREPQDQTTGRSAGQARGQGSENR
jgi:molecular chaperone DnaJ